MLRGITRKHLARTTIILFAGLLAGFCALDEPSSDQLIFLEAGLRQLQGQIPYRDFQVPQGPVAGMVLSLILFWLPTSGYALIVASALLNAAASFVAGKVVCELGGDTKDSLVASALTAAWFLPPMGSYYNDQLAYFFILWGFYLHLKKPGSWGSASLMVLAFHSKQTVGFMGFASLLLSLGIGRGSRGYLRPGSFLVARYLACQLVALSAIAVCGDIDKYLRYVILAPLQYARLVPHAQPLRLISFLLLPWHVNPFRAFREGGMGQIGILPFLLISYAAAVLVWRRRQRASGLFFLWLSTFWCGALVGRLHAHLFFGMGAVTALVLRELSRFTWARRGSWWIGGVLCGIGVLYSLRLHWPASTREALFESSDLYPVRISLRKENAEIPCLVNFLKPRPWDYAILGKSEIHLIPLALGRAPVNPAVYYQVDLTVPRTSPWREKWESELISALEPTRVRFLISNCPFDPLRGVTRFIVQNFVALATVNGYSLFERKHGLGSSETTSPVELRALRSCLASRPQLSREFLVRKSGTPPRGRKVNRGST